jgi:molecular chaperone HtpG
MSNVETLEFQAEARQLLHLMVHSVYSHKDVFLRELISNASDALDKVRLEALLNKEAKINTEDLHIRLDLDKDARTLTVRDNGIGMSRDEVKNLIGTIAKSGTAEFVKMLKKSRDEAVNAELIGQFGVGFYSSFMVADKVTLLTRRAGQEGGVRWESSGDGTYTLEDMPDLPQGTSITLHLKPEDKEDQLGDYTDPWVVRDLVKRYSDFISYPIKMEVEHKDYDNEGKVKATRLELETLNSMKAIWARPKDEVKPEEYNEFYKHVAHDWTDPLEVIHMRAEGTFEYQALLYIPSHAPFDLFMRDAKRGVQLYVKRVFIMDNCEELMPEYLRFVKGVVDAQDLSLNVSREILQKDRHIQVIRKRLVIKVLDTLKEMAAEKPEQFATFWKEFGRALKEGLYTDHENRERILELCRFASTRSDELTSLGAYVERMKDGQDAIYYLNGESREALAASPHLEAFKAKDIEVLLLIDPVDELWVQYVPEFQKKPLTSAARGDVQLGTEEEKKAAETQREEQQKDFATTLAWMHSKLSDDIKEVRLSNRLTSSPACLVGDQNDMTPTMEKLMRAMGQEPPKVKRILEVNPQHPLVTGLHRVYSERKDDATLAEAVELLYGMAVLAEGGDLHDPARFSRLLADALVRGLIGGAGNAGATPGAASISEEPPAAQKTSKSSKKKKAE